LNIWTISAVTLTPSKNYIFISFSLLIKVFASFSYLNWTLKDLVSAFKIVSTSVTIYSSILNLSFSNKMLLKSENFVWSGKLFSNTIEHFVFYSFSVSLTFIVSFNFGIID
jgi:hypothetical protein